MPTDERCTCDACNNYYRQADARRAAQPRDELGRFISPSIEEPEPTETRIIVDDTSDEFTMQYTWPDTDDSIAVYIRPNRPTIFTAHLEGQQATSDLNLRFNDMEYRFNRSAATLASWLQDRITITYWGTWEGRDHYGHELPEQFTGQVAQHVTGRWAEANPQCDVCNIRHRMIEGMDEEQQHFECENCQEVRPREQRNMIALEHTDQAATTMVLCGDCAEDSDVVTSCYECGSALCTDCAPQAPNGDPYCDHCFNNNYQYCDECEEYAHYNDFRSVSDGDDVCQSCYEERLRGPGEIKNWSYRPDFIFHPDMPQDSTKPLYIGMEVEVSLLDKYNHAASEIVDWRNNTPEDLIYFKSDSSVNNGFEMVTHPMQPEWALKHMPWGWLDVLAKYARPTHDSTGTHIHVNKEAFSATHLWKFMQIHFRLADFCGLVGGRGTTAGYGALVSGGRNGPTKQRKDLMQIVKKKGAINDYDRSIGLNVQNEYTIEMRYMRGGTSIAEMKKNIEWALALYEFSDQLQVRYVRDGVLDDPGYLMQWLMDRQERFPNLVDWIQTRTPSPKKLPTYDDQPQRPPNTLMFGEDGR